MNNYKHIQKEMDEIARRLEYKRTRQAVFIQTFMILAAVGLIYGFFAVFVPWVESEQAARHEQLVQSCERYSRALELPWKKSKDSMFCYYQYNGDWFRFSELEALGLINKQSTGDE